MPPCRTAWRRRDPFVLGDDTEAVRRLFDPDARSFLTQRTKWMFRSDGRWLLMCEIGKWPKPVSYRAFVAEWPRECE